MKNPITVCLTDDGIKGRNNVEIWNRVNWANPYDAIARRLGVTRKAVHNQGKKRGLVSLYPRGGRLRYNARYQYVEGPIPLPNPLPPL